MAITQYLRDCKYTVGGLKPFIYLIPKDALIINLKASRQRVRFKNKGTTIYKINSALNVYNQEETYENRFRFSSTLEVTINELYEEPFFYGLRTLRENQFYIVIEDKQGLQYLVNPELFTTLTYEYTFTDIDDAQNNVTLTFTNVSNHPLLIFDEKVTETDILLDTQCAYNIGHTTTLRMISFKDLEICDDGVKVTKLYVEDHTLLKRVDYVPQSFTITEKYDGEKFETEMEFSIPLDDNQFFWSYDLLEFKDNLYKALVRTTNQNYLVLGNEKGLFPSYKIKTGEDDSEQNLVTFTFKQLSQYPTLYTNDTTMYKWVDDGELCFGFNKYQMLKQLKSTDYGAHWADTDPIEKKKGVILEENSPDCGYEILHQWVETDEYNCEVTIIYERWININDFICDGGNKYRKTQRQVSIDSGKTWVNYDEYGKGALLEENSEECQYVVTRWVEDGEEYIFIDDRYTTYNSEITGTTCSGTTKMNVIDNTIKVSNDGVNFITLHQDNTYTVNEEESCECGYYYWEGTHTGEYICGYQLGDSYESTSKYEKILGYKYCKGHRIDPDEIPTINWQKVEEESCECGYYYIGEWEETDNYKCGYEFNLHTSNVNLSNLEQVEINDKSFTFSPIHLNTTGNTSGVITFVVNKPCNMNATIQKSTSSSNISCTIGKVDTEIESSVIDALLSCTTTTSKELRNISISSGEHSIPVILYRKSTSSTYNNYSCNIMLSFEEIEESDYIDISKYRQYKKYRYCDGVRIPEEGDETHQAYTAESKWVEFEPKSYDCGYMSAHYEIDTTDMCGHSLPPDTEIVDNVDINKEEDYNG